MNTVAKQTINTNNKLLKIGECYKALHLTGRMSTERQGHHLIHWKTLHLSPINYKYLEVHLIDCSCQGID